MCKNSKLFGTTTSDIMKFARDISTPIMIEPSSTDVKQLCESIRVQIDMQNAKSECILAARECYNGTKPKSLNSDQCATVAQQLMWTMDRMLEFVDIERNPVMPIKDKVNEYKRLANAFNGTCGNVNKALT